jgi:hypothetical protein
LHFLKIGVFEGVNFLAFDLADGIDVVEGVHGADGPHAVLVEGTEEHHFDHDVTVRGFLHECAQAFEVLGVPLVQVELVAADGIAGLLAARPGADQFPFERGECVALDAEVSGRFAIGAAEGAGEVQAVGLKRGKVFSVVECAVQDGSIVFARGDENDRAAAPEQVMGIVRVQLEGRGGQGA